MIVPFSLYALQVIACFIRMAIPNEVRSYGPYQVKALWGISYEFAAVPVLGLMVFSGDGNRIHVYKNGDLVQEYSIDLFDDFDFNSIRYDSVSDALHLPD